MLSTQSDLMFLYFLFSKRINLLRFFSAMASATGLLRDLSAFYSLCFLVKVCVYEKGLVNQSARVFCFNYCDT